MTITAALTSTPWTRRNFIVASGAAGAGLALIGTAKFTFAQPSAQGDLAIARFAASLEVLAVNTYTAALSAATAGRLGTVPPAVATYVQTAQAHHQFARDQWNNVIRSAGGAAVDQPPADLNATVQQAFGQVTNVTGVAELALMLEQIAADTYLSAIPNLSSAAAIELAGNFQIIDQQHASILLYVLGRYPVPDVFQTGAKAASPQAAPAPQTGSQTGPTAVPKPGAPTPSVQMPAQMPRTGDGSSVGNSP
ncbi:MAG: ferritin-like domain-containing protein [Chloroflexota bacterium]